MEDVVIGQIWVWESEDPFSDLLYERKRVLAVTEGYVKFERRLFYKNHISDKAIKSESIWWFTGDSKLESQTSLEVKKAIEVAIQNEPKPKRWFTRDKTMSLLDRMCNTICIVLLVTFITLKLTDHITWSWWWILSPILLCIRLKFKPLKPIQGIMQFKGKNEHEI